MEDFSFADFGGMVEDTADIVSGIAGLTRGIRGIARCVNQDGGMQSGRVLSPPPPQTMVFPTQTVVQGPGAVHVVPLQMGPTQVQSPILLQTVPGPVPAVSPQMGPFPVPPAVPLQTVPGPVPAVSPLMGPVQVPPAVPLQTVPGPVPAVSPQMGPVQGQPVLAPVAANVAVQPPQAAQFVQSGLQLVQPGQQSVLMTQQNPVAGGTQTSSNSCLAWTSLVISLFTCCWPFGLISVKYSKRAALAKSRGNYSNAASFGKQAKTFAIVAIVLSIIIFCLLLVLFLIGGIMSSSSSSSSENFNNSY